MKQSDKLKMIIKKIVQEEVGKEIKKVLTEMKSSGTSRPNPPTVPKKFSNNSILDDILNETYEDGDWKSMKQDGGAYTSSDMSQLLGNNPQASKSEAVRSVGGDPNNVPDHVSKALTKDYRQVMKAVNKKKGV